MDIELLSRNAYNVGVELMNMLNGPMPVDQLSAEEALEAAKAMLIATQANGKIDTDQLPDVIQAQLAAMNRRKVLQEFSSEVVSREGSTRVRQYITHSVVLWTEEMVAAGMSDSDCAAITLHFLGLIISPMRLLSDEEVRVAARESIAEEQEHRLTCSAYNGDTSAALEKLFSMTDPGTKQ